jgi:hypothetical protein
LRFGSMGWREEAGGNAAKRSKNVPNGAGWSEAVEDGAERSGNECKGAGWSGKELERVSKSRTKRKRAGRNRMDESNAELHEIAKQVKMRSGSMTQAEARGSECSETRRK